MSTSLFILTNDWYQNINAGNYTYVIFIDSHKAFETVDHMILLQKLANYEFLAKY